MNMIRALMGAAQEGRALNHQEAELLKSAAKRLQAQQSRIDELITALADREERIALLEERLAIETEGAGEIPAELGAAPGEAAEDFWEDGWPLD